MVRGAFVVTEVFLEFDRARKRELENAIITCSIHSVQQVKSKFPEGDDRAPVRFDRFDERRCAVASAAPFPEETGVDYQRYHEENHLKIEIADRIAIVTL